jgi:glycosyltransferase involved in cell wall biosynthesis
MKSTAQKPGYLVVICSSNQLYSGTGTALFEWIRYAKERFHFGLLMDCDDKKNFDIGRAFCTDNGIEFFTEVPARKWGACDPGVARIAHHLRSGRWPYVEIVSWANAATNIDVVSSIPYETKLIFTPHAQPIWTLPGSDDHFLVEPVLRLCLERADLVCCDSPAEVTTLREKVPAVRAVSLPIGVDDAKYTLVPDGRRQEQVLMVCDCIEHRKRVDLAVAAVERAMRSRDLAFVMVGRGSDKVRISPEMEPRVTRLGYVNERDLISLYQNSSVFLLLSDYEAFGIPIVEALFCGSEAVINDTAEMRSLYRELPGVHLVDNRNDAVIDAAIAAALRGTASPASIRGAAVSRFAKATAFRRKLEAIEVLGVRPPIDESRFLEADVAL